MHEPKQGREMWSEKYPGTNHENDTLAKLNNGLGYEKTGWLAELQVGALFPPHRWPGRYGGGRRESFSVNHHVQITEPCQIKMGLHLKETRCVTVRCIIHMYLCTFVFCTRFPSAFNAPSLFSLSPQPSELLASL